MGMDLTLVMQGEDWKPVGPRANALCSVLASKAGSASEVQWRVS